MRNLQLIFLAILHYVYGTDVEQLWTKYKSDYKKSYNATEELLRLKIFKDNLKEITHHNGNFKKGLVTYEMEINKFADLTVDEYRVKYKMFPTITFTYTDNDTLPKANEIESGEDDNVAEHLDWREKGAVTPVKNQGTCGSCWIFSAIGVLEGFYFKKYNKLISFSEQDMVDCISNSSCRGGWPPLVFDHVKKHGVVKEEDYKYEEKQGECQKNKSGIINISFDKLVRVENNETKLKEAVTNHGPVIVCIYATSKWMFYKSGVWYEKECSFLSNHAMVLVGYGKENGVDYWLVKNSMGEDWGENGYIKIARNKHHNYCGITATAFYVV